MSPREVELALKKQRLQFQSAALRARLGQQAHTLQAPFAAVDRVRAGYGWLRDRPYIWVGAAVALAVMRPRAAWRWLKRGFIWWQGAQRLRGWVERAAPLYLAAQQPSDDGRPAPISVQALIAQFTRL
ncbi:YqjK family protein [Aquabacterium sp.]|uniref:YqjK family protein n=1 Tax=Aquabacterium sp. TaxID=1872578 RepID=UPI0035B48BCB